MHLPNHGWGWKLHLQLFRIGDKQGPYQGSQQCLLGCAVAWPPAGIPWASTKILSAVVAGLQAWVLGNVRLRSASVPKRCAVCRNPSIPCSPPEAGATWCDYICCCGRVLAAVLLVVFRWHRRRRARVEHCIHLGFLLQWVPTGENLII